MVVKHKGNVVLFLTLAIVIALFTSIKVSVQSHFWIDDKVASLFSHTPDFMIPFFIKITEMGDKKGIGIVLVLILLWLLFKQRNYVGAGVLALSVVLGNELSKLLKGLFIRPRPPESERLIHVTSYSFPSGHAMVGMIVYFMIAYLLIQGSSSKKVKTIIAVLTAILLLIIGASRIILRVHFPSDVLAGYSFGFIWVMIWIFIYTHFKDKQKRE